MTKNRRGHDNSIGQSVETAVWLSRAAIIAVRPLRRDGVLGVADGRLYCFGWRCHVFSHSD
jgi:hypothetical protein